MRGEEVKCVLGGGGVSRVVFSSPIDEAGTFSLEWRAGNEDPAPPT